MKKSIVVYSGGMDSRTVLQVALEESSTVLAISFDYGQRHVKELSCAKKVCVHLGVSHKIVNMQFMRDIASNSALTSGKPVPEGHYTANNMRDTIVPNRNMIMLSIALAYAINEGASSVYYGAHSGDHAIYPDCRPEFVESITNTAKLIHDTPIDIKVPFINGDKKTILDWGLAHGVDYSDTWTCYAGDIDPCGKCGACVERAEAFTELNLTDPLCE